MKALDNKILVIYHYFPHYRKGVMHALKQQFPNILFAGSPTSEPIAGSIKTFIPEPFIELRIKKIGGGFYYLKGLNDVLLQSKISDVIILGDTHLLNSWLLPLVCRFRGISISFWAHGWLQESEPLLKRIFRNTYFSLPNKVLTYGRRARKIAATQGFSQNNVHVIYNSLNYHEQQEIRLRSSEGNTTPLHFLCCARLTYEKKFDLVIKAISKLEANIRPKLLLVGEGPAKKELELLSKMLGVEAEFYGSCYSEVELFQLYHKSYAVISPGNVGLTAMHSLAYGIPVITHSNNDNQMPEAEAIINEVTGWLFEENDVKSLAEKIKLALSSSSYDRKKISDNCVAMIEKFFTPQKQVEKISRAIQGFSEIEPLTDCISYDEIK